MESKILNKCKHPSHRRGKTRDRFSSPSYISLSSSLPFGVAIRSGCPSFFLGVAAVVLATRRSGVECLHEGPEPVSTKFELSQKAIGEQKTAQEHA